MRNKNNLKNNVICKIKDTLPEITLANICGELVLDIESNIISTENLTSCFLKKNIIFCDGNFWHGNNWQIKLNSLEDELNNYSEFWKIKFLKIFKEIG